MPKIAYIERRFRSDSLNTINTANEIIEEYAEEDLDLTVRQLYYQFVARGLIPNKQKEYDRLSQLLSKGRLAGLVDWDAIVDRTRNLKGLATWNDPGEIIRSCVYSYRIDKWENQPYYIEVWIEKDALTGIINKICNKHQIDYFACRGYVSQSEMWRAAVRRIKWRLEEGKTCVIIHLGDHDPSGIDMTRDITDRLQLFLDNPDIYVSRIALNMHQVELYSPPPNPAKISDSRAIKYINKFGHESWELDALEPRVIRNLIDAKVSSFKEEDIWEKDLGIEKEQKKILKDFANNWEDK